MTFSEGMNGVTSSSCIKLVNAIIVSPAVPTTGSPETEWVLINVALWCVCVCALCVCVCVTLAD